MTAPEPTTEQVEAAQDVLLCEPDEYDRTSCLQHGLPWEACHWVAIARALAAAVNAEREKVHRVARAAVYEAYIIGNENGSEGLYDPQQAEVAARRIREVAG